MPASHFHWSIMHRSSWYHESAMPYARTTRNTSAAVTAVRTRMHPEYRADASPA